MLFGICKILRARIPSVSFYFFDYINGSKTTFIKVHTLDDKRRTTKEDSKKNKEFDQESLRDAISKELELKLLDMYERLRKDLMLEMKK